MPTDHEVTITADGTAIQRPDAPDPGERVPLKRLAPGRYLLAHPGSRIASATQDGAALRVTLTDGATFETALDRLSAASGQQPDNGEIQADLLVHGGTLLLRPVRAPAEPLLLFDQGAVAARNGIVVASGPESRVRDQTRLTPDAVVLDTGGGLITPGLVDPHTHLVFAGDRSHEFALRARGATYREIAAAGGGIRSTMEATRAASDDELERLAAARVKALLERGVTTAEAKSGYALDLRGELRLLEVLGRLDRTLPFELSPTLLGAHVLPPEYADDRAGYVDVVCDEMIPRAAERRLARAVDVYCDPGAFDLEESRYILESARAHGLARRIHAEQFDNLESAGMAAALDAVSADHLEAVSDASIRAMAEAGTVAVLLPGAALTLKCPWPPADRLRDAGVALALGTDLNPGTSMTENLHLMMSLGCMQMGMTVEEAWAGVTTNAARAACCDRGRLDPGVAADLVIWDCEHWATIPYHYGANHVRTVVKSGQVVLERQ